MFEIYNENVRDLLAPGAHTKVRVQGYLDHKKSFFPRTLQ